MFRLALDRRLARKAAKPEDVFDLGAGPRNCIACAARSGPKEEIGYCCATFVDAVTGAHLPAFDMRADGSACGESALGFSPVGEEKFYGLRDPLTGHIATPLDSPYEIDPLISDDPIVAATGEERACRECAHSFISYFGSLTSDTYCARAICTNTANPIPVANVRGSEELCGAAGAWFEEPPPITDDEAMILAGGGSTFFHW
jgi:hypothetical protein